MMIRTTPIYFFFNDTPTTEIYTLSLHDALPIYPRSLSAPAQQGYPGRRDAFGVAQQPAVRRRDRSAAAGDRKSTRLNSSHSQISYAVFCLKKKKKHKYEYRLD